ncbi:MAG: GH32 C-terminal domain-containing protein, partial [Verrucomicrobiota bacterium]
EPGSAREVVFRVRGATVVYNVAKEELVVDGHKAPAPLREGRQAITIYADRTGLEVFASGGLTYVPKPFQPRAEDQSVEVDVKGGSAVFRTLRAYPLRSIWKGSR